jgi:hypothetical protein
MPPALVEVIAPPAERETSANLPKGGENQGYTSLESHWPVNRTEQMGFQLTTFESSWVVIPGLTRNPEWFVWQRLLDAGSSPA